MSLGSTIIELSANLGLDTSQFKRGMEEAQQQASTFARSVSSDVSGASEAMSRLGSAHTEVGQGAGKLATALGGNLRSALQSVVQGTGLVVGAFAAFKAIEVASRVEEMDIALTNLGRNAGKSADEVHKQVDAIKELGITTNSAQNALASFFKQNLDTAQASKLARVAQDAAVYSMEDSSSTLDRLVWGITTYNTEVLRTAGITVNVGRSFEMMAQQLNKSTSDLTEAERQQAVMNAVLKEGATLQGTYEAAMATGSKQMRSFPRYIDNIQESIGTSLLPAFDKFVFILKDVAEGIDALVKKGGALRPVLNTIGAAAVVGFKVLGAAVKAVLAVMDRFKWVITIIGTVLVAKAVVGLVSLAAGFAKARVAAMQNAIAARFSVEADNERALASERVALAKNAEAAASARAGAAALLAARNATSAAGVSTVSMVGANTATTAASGAAVAGTTAAAGSSFTAGSVGAGMLGLVGGVPGLAVMGGMALLAGGMYLYQRRQQQDAEATQAAQEKFARRLGNENDPYQKRAVAIDEQRKSMQAARRRMKRDLKGFDGPILSTLQHPEYITDDKTREIVRNTSGEYTAKQQRAAVTEYMAATTYGGKSSKQYKVAAENRRKAQADIDFIEERAKGIGSAAGASTESVKALAASMGIDLLKASKEDLKAMTDLLTVTKGSSPAAQEFAVALSTVTNAEKTGSEQAAALTEALKKLVSSTYEVDSATRSSMDALAQQDRAYKDAAKSGGDSLKQFKQHWSEHNQAIADSMIETGAAMRDAGSSGMEYARWMTQFRDKAIEQARAQGQTNDQVVTFTKLLDNIAIGGLAKLPAEQALEALRNLGPAMKITSAGLISTLMSDFKKAGERAKVGLTLYPRVDWSAFSSMEKAGLLRQAIRTGEAINIEMLMSLYGADKAKTLLEEVNSLDDQIRSKARHAITQRYNLVVGIQADPAAMAWLRNAVRITGSTEGASALARELARRQGAPGIDSLAPSSIGDLARANIYDLNALLSSIPQPTGGGGSGDNSVIPDGGGGGGKTAEELAREARRMQTAMQTISSIAVPPAAQRAFDTFPKLEDREKIAADLTSWRSNYTKTLAEIVKSTDESTARIVVSWGLPQEQLSSVAGWVNSLGNAFRSFSSITNPNALASGRSGNRLEEWVDGLIELKNRGLNPMLLRQLMEAGPDSLGAIRRLLRSGSALWQANAQYDRITGELNRLVADPMLGVGLGADLTGGIARGIYDASGGALVAARDFLNQLVDEMKKEMGIASPSKVTAEQIGRPMVDGIAHAISNGSGRVGGALQSAVDSVSTGGISTSTGAAVIENHFHVAGFVVDRKSVDAMIEAQDWAMRTSGGR